MSAVLTISSILNLSLQSDLDDHDLHLGRTAASASRPPCQPSPTPLPLSGKLTWILTSAPAVHFENSLYSRRPPPSPPTRLSSVVLLFPTQPFLADLLHPAGPQERVVVHMTGQVLGPHEREVPTTGLVLAPQFEVTSHLPPTVERLATLLLHLLPPSAVKPSPPIANPGARWDQPFPCLFPRNVG